MQVPPRLRRALVAVLLTGSLPVLTGCASGFDSPVLQDYNAPVGVNRRGGDVWALNMLVVMPESGRGTLVGALLNTTRTPDRLVGATVRSEPDEAPVRSTLLRPDVVLEPQQLVEMSDEPTVLVEGEITPGRFVRVDLRFERSAPVQARIPVVSTEGAYADVPLP